MDPREEFTYPRARWETLWGKVTDDAAVDRIGNALDCDDDDPLTIGFPPREAAHVAAAVRALDSLTQDRDNLRRQLAEAVYAAVAEAAYPGWPMPDNTDDFADALQTVRAAIGHLRYESAHCRELAEDRLRQIHRLESQLREAPVLARFPAAVLKSVDELNVGDLVEPVDHNTGYCRMEVLHHDRTEGYVVFGRPWGKAELAGLTTASMLTSAECFSQPYRPAHRNHPKSYRVFER